MTSTNQSRPTLLTRMAYALIGGLRKIGCGRRRRRSLQSALAEDRRRIARDLHDYVAQELAFLSLRGRHAAEREADDEARELADAADRALAQTRTMIGALRNPSPDDRSHAGQAGSTTAGGATELERMPLHAAIGRLAEELTTRAGAQLRLDLDPRAELPAAGVRELLGIVREALSNSLRHGRAGAINIELSCEDGLRLRIGDDGAGFDPAALKHRSAGFGLVGMAERARAGGGEVRLKSQPGLGTQLEVILPCGRSGS